MTAPELLGWRHVISLLKGFLNNMFTIFKPFRSIASYWFSHSNHRISEYENFVSIVSDTYVNLGGRNHKLYKIAVKHVATMFSKFNHSKSLTTLLHFKVFSSKYSAYFKSLKWFNQFLQYAGENAKNWKMVLRIENLNWKKKRNRTLFSKIILESKNHDKKYLRNPERFLAAVFFVQWKGCNLIHRKMFLLYSVCRKKSDELFNLILLLIHNCKLILTFFMQLFNTI